MADTAGPSGPTTNDLAAARTLLFVPGNRPERFERAPSSGADAVICDLEDAVPESEKAQARAAVARWLSHGGVACVRINTTRSHYINADCAALRAAPGLRAVVIPKAEGPDDIASVRSMLGRDLPLIPLIESALGVQRAFEIAKMPGVVRLGFGSLDYANDVSAAHDDITLLYPRSALVVASRAAEIASPVDGITTSLDDETLAKADAVKARKLGFSGKLCIHPRQVMAVNSAFAPTADEVLWAHRITEAASDGACRIDDQMVDAPLTERARRILRNAGLVDDAITEEKTR